MYLIQLENEAHPSHFAAKKRKKPWLSYVVGYVAIIIPTELSTCEVTASQQYVYRGDKNGTV